MADPSIRFLIPYFGRWPAWMPFFVETVRWNPTIDWFFYTDCGPIPNCPPNIRLKNIPFSEYCEHVSTTLKIDFKPSSPYKLCDLKPAYGYLHAEDLKGVDFWAFGDIDIVLGDLRAYFTTQRLAKKDLFSTHARRISGHMCLIRNTREFNEAFMRIPPWQALYSADRHYAADEGPFTRLFLKHKNLPSGLANLLGNLYRLRRRSEFIEAFSTPDGNVPWHNGSLKFPDVWTWKDGKLRNNEDGNRLFPYLHFFVWKRTWGENGSLAVKPEMLGNLSLGFEVRRDGFHVNTQ